MQEFGAEMEIKQEPVDYENEERIRNILGQEFVREIEEREEQIMQIETRIQHVKRFIHFVKYSAVSCFYQKEKTDDSEIEQGIHPCVKRFLKEQCEKPKNLRAEDIDSDAVNKELIGPNVIDERMEDSLTVVRGTYKVRHQIVIGNISKWQESRDDGATHKWMIYVRDKTDENWEKLVKKVRYFLHESYKPHDVIDVTSWPFHLTRRGWGEFPVRITIFFKHSANKPVDFVYQLRLDQSCSGVDKLGGETVFEVDLVHEDLKIPDQVVTGSQQESITNGPEALIDHDYCRTSKYSKNSQEYAGCLKQLSSNALSVGAETSEINALQEWSLDNDGPIVEWYESDVIKRLSSIVFFSTEACVKWFLKRWPMVSAHANTPQYKNVHAYCFPSGQEFGEVSEPRRFAAEWYRAYKIRTMLQRLNLCPWTTKQILTYARMHGYVVVLTNRFNLPDTSGPFSTFTCDIDRDHDMRQLEPASCEEIDVVSDDIVKTTSVSPCKKRVVFASTWAQVVTIFNKQIGVRLGEDVIDDLNVANVPSVVLGHVLKLFLDDLLRKSLCNAWLRNKNNNPGSLEVSDIAKSIIDCPEFDILTNVGLGSNNGV